MPGRVKRCLRWVRRRMSGAIGALIAAWPQLEPGYVRTGRWVAERSSLFGTLYWLSQDDLIRRLRESGRRFRFLTVFGQTLALDITDCSARPHYFYGRPYEPQLARAVSDCLSDGDVFVDVGANAGFFSVLAGKRVGDQGAVIAFEPHPAARALFQQALAENGLTATVEVCNAAVGAHDGAAHLFLSHDSVLSTLDPSRAPARDHVFPDSLAVPLVTLDTWFSRRPSLRSRVRAVKIDVEGTEADVVQGMSDILHTCPPPHVFCETTPNSPADHLLRSSGYRVIALDMYIDVLGNYWYTRER